MRGYKARAGWGHTQNRCFLADLLACAWRVVVQGCLLNTFVGKLVAGAGERTYSL